MLVEGQLNNHINKYELKSKLLETIINNNSFKRALKNFGAYIESRSDRVYRAVLDKGEFKGSKNILLSDYETLLNAYN